MEAPAEVGRRTRRMVHAFLLVFAVTGLATLELFPFSGFRLFAERRPEVRESWQLRAVDPAGAETPIRLDDLPLGYRNTSGLLQGFDALSKAEQDAVCDAWARPLRDAGAQIEAVRVYAVRDSVRPEGPPAQRSLAYECGAGP